MAFNRNNNKSKAEQTGTPNKYPQGNFKNKKCRWCELEFNPNAPSELYCSDVCKDEASTNKYLEKTYGLTVEEYREMYYEQDGLCKICGEVGFKLDKRSVNNLVVDHCHGTGEVRGLLCHNCNRALGLLKDNVKRFHKAIKYLESATTISKESTPK